MVHQVDALLAVDSEIDNLDAMLAGGLFHDAAARARSWSAPYLSAVADLVVLGADVYRQPVLGHRLAHVDLLVRSAVPGSVTSARRAFAFIEHSTELRPLRGAFSC